MTLRGAIIGAALAAVAGAALPAHAERPLHEQVDSPRRGEGPLIEQAADGENPSALRVQGGRELPEPSHTEELGRGEDAMAPPPSSVPDGVPPHQSFRPDLSTDRFPGDLRYTATFQPSVAPNKRLSSLDTVGESYELTVGTTTLRPVPVGGQPEAGRELFWGSVAVDLAPQRPVQIPSVAAEVRILSVRTRPEREITFLRDGADNYFVQSPEGGRTRLIFVMDAPAAYFGGPISPTLTAEDVAPALRPSLPPRIDRAARHVAAELGLSQTAPLTRNLTRLVAYLRSFSSDPLGPVPSDADPYVTLALGRRGVCRHRAFVFVITAQGLGLPARLITNEAHAFAEAYIPGTGWRRVDLGGEGPLPELDQDVVRHEPTERDPFPWPSSQPSRPVSTSQQGSGGPPTQGQGGSEGGTSTPSQGGSPSQGAAQSQGPTEGAIPGEEGAGEEGAGEEGAELEPESAAQEPAPEEAAAVRRIVLDQHSRVAIRGEGIRLVGHVEGEDPARVPVALWLHNSAPGGVRIGQTASDDQGQFETRVVVPSDLPAGDYVIVAR